MMWGIKQIYGQWEDIVLWWGDGAHIVQHNAHTECTVCFF